MNKQPTTHTTESGSFFDSLRKKVETRAGKFTASTMIVLGAATLSACAETPAPQPSTSQSPEAEPTPEAPAIPEIITNYEAMTPEEFETLPTRDRLTYVDYRMKENAEDHEAILAEYDRPEWTEPSLNSSAQEIVDNYSYVLDMAGWQQERDPSTGEIVHDKDEALKLISGAYYAVGTGVISNVYLSQRELTRNQEGPLVDELRYTAQGNSGVKEGFRNDELVKYIDINYYSSNGNDAIARYIYTEYTDTAGEVKGMWLFDQSQQPEEPPKDLPTAK